MESVTASAPGRVNLIGEHLDYNGGACLPIAIDLRTTATVRRHPGPAHRLVSPVAPAGWERYVLGVLTELSVHEPVEVVVSSTLPIGAGLSSSAALTCSVALAVNELFGKGLDRFELISAAITAENVHVGVPSGGLDQSAAFFGEPGRAVLLEFEAGTIATVPWQPELDGLVLLVVDTRVQHALVRGDYADRRRDCAEASRLLAPVRLVDADEDLIAHLPPALRRRARHVVTEQRRVSAFVAAASARDWDLAGSLMSASHWSLRDDYEVSCAELDAVVETALGHGAAGARMTGGGFGGSAIVLVPSARVEAVSDAVRAHPIWNGKEAPTLFRVEASSAACVDQVT